MDRRVIRNKKNKPRNVRPYDRPNQGILGKVASKVKDLLTPSWIFNVPRWISTPQEQPGSSSTPDEESDDEDEIPPQSTSTTTMSSTSHGSKRPRLRLHEPGPSILSEGTQTWLDTPSPSNLFNQSPHLPCTVTQNSLVENKESPVIMNGDDHSENSEGSASTSGCSSLVSSHKERSNCLGPSNLRLSEAALANLRGTLKNTVELKNRRDLSSQNEGFSSPNTSASRLSLWSGGLSPAAKFHRRSPSVANSSQPGFNVSAFVAPSKVNQQIERKVASPFYQGKTSFGGASSARKMPASTAPYQVERPSRNQIKVRSSQPEDSLEGMSSAAKRILLTLEKMSSPVTDAKKIPNTNKSPVDLSLYMMPPKHRSNVVSTPAGTPKGPPIANISTISKLTTLKSCGMRKFQNSAMESLPAPSEVKNKVPADIFQSDLHQTPLAKDGGGGKMKNKIPHHYRPSIGNTSLEQLESVPLPNVPLPISNLPTFSFGPKTDKSSDLINKIGSDFLFSSPIVVLPKLPVHNNISVPHVDSNLQSSNVSQEKETFTFSSPIEHELPSPILGGVFTTNSPGSWQCGSCWVRSSTNESKCIACETPKPSLNSTEPKLPMPSIPVTKSLSNFSSNLTNPPSTWKCNSCWIQNPLKESKCLACETPKPCTSSGFTLPTPKTTNVSISSSSTWQCNECWVKNHAQQEKCLACETPKPGSTVDQAKSSNPAFGLSSSGTSGFFSHTLSSSSGGFKLPDIPCDSTDQTVTFGGFKLPAVKPSDSEPNKLGVKTTNDFFTSKLSEASKTSPSKNSDLSTLESIAKSVCSSKAAASSTLNGPSKVSFATKNLSNAENMVSEKEKTNSNFNFKTNVTAQSSPVTTSFSGKPLLVSNPPGSWECDTCMLRNTSDTQKCVACESTRPSKANVSGFQTNPLATSAPTFGSNTSTFSFGKTESTNQLPTTQASSGFGVNTIQPMFGGAAAPAFGKGEKPGFNFGLPQDSTTPVFQLGMLVSNPPGSWECDTCMVRNTSDKQKCVACETLRPSKANMSGLKDVESFKFSSPLQSSPITFKFNSASTSQTTATTSTFAFGSSSTTTSTFFTPVSSVATSVSSTNEPKVVSLTETSTPKPSVPEFKFDAPKVTTLDSSKPSIPVIDLVDKKENTDAKPSLFSIPVSKSSNEGSSLPSITNSSSSAFKITTPAVANTSVTPFMSTENKLTLSVPVKKDTTEAVSLVSDTNKIESVSSVTSKDAPIGGFNFKIPSSATSPFGGFGTANLNTDSKLTPQAKGINVNAEKKPDATLGVNVSSPSMSSPFLLPTSTPLFKAVDKVESVKTSEAHGIKKNVFASSVGSSSTTTTSTFNFTNSPIPLSGMAPTSSQPSLSLAPTQTQSFGTMAKNQDLKTVASVTSFSAATTPSTFTFGASAATTTQSNPSSGFSFFTSSAANATPSTTPSLFMFGNSNASQTTTTGGSAQSTNSTFSGFQTNPSATPAFQFGNQPAASTAPAPTFGSNTSTFSFGKTEPTNQLPTTQASRFQTNPSATPAFQFGNNPPAVNTAPAPTFGSNTSTFSFGKTESTNQLPTTQASSGFGVNTIQPMFGGAAAPAFGKTEKPAFNFGLPQGSSAPVFQFGEKKQATAPQFFGTPSQEPTAPNPAPSFPAPQFNFNTPTTFNFAATNNPGPFQFAASSTTDSQSSSAPRKIRKAVRRVPR